MKSKNWLQQAVLFGYFTFWGIYFFLFWAKALYYDDFGNLVAGHVNIWGDWAAHMTMGMAMGVRGPLLDTSPLIINHPFAYPFVSNMISGILFRLGFSIIDSFIFPSFLFSMGLIYGLFWLYKVMFKSRKIALIASLIFLFNGGVGFYYFASDVATSPTPVKTLLNPPHEYTRYDEKGIKWISVIDSMVIPQRAFSLGFPLGLVALGLIYQATYNKQSTQQKRWKILTAGTILGFLPIIHTHSFLALFIILTSWSSLDILTHWNTKKVIPKLLHWLSVAVITALFALPLIFMFLSQNISQGFITWYPGWLAIDFEENWLVFWFKNWTIVPILAAASWALLLNSTSKKIKHFGRLFVPFFFIFVIANLWLFQPWPWDNTKLLIWSSVGFSGLVAWLLMAGWKHTLKLNALKRKTLRALLIACFGLITASGMIDAYYIVRHDLHSHVMFSREEVQLANWARESTDSNSRWLTGDQHNHWLFVLTGRQALMTYRGWMWTHGYNYRPIEAAVSKMFAQPEENLDLFSEYDVDYIVIGPNEKKVWRADTGFYAQHFTLIKETQNYRVYATEASAETSDEND